LQGGDFQEHKSGWLPGEFSTEWEIYACEKYHCLDDDGNLLKKPFGAFYAIRNIIQLDIDTSKNLKYKFFKPTAKELANRVVMQELEEVKNSFQILLDEKQNLIQILLDEKQDLLNSRSWKITLPLRKAKSFFGSNSRTPYKLRTYFRR
jgi:hypothetical protein